MKMWKPSKRLVTWVLVVLLIYNLVTLSLVVLFKVSWVDGWGIGYSRGDNLRLSSDASIFAEQMKKVDNKPQIIAIFYESSNPSTPFLFIPDWSAGFRMSATNEIQVGEFVFQRLDGNLQVVNTGYIIDNGADWSTSWYNLLKNFLIPWHLEKIEVNVSNEGTLHNIVPDTSQPENALYENLNFLFFNVSIRHHEELSPWGPIHLLIMVGALVYLKKPWNLIKRKLKQVGWQKKSGKN